MNNQQQSKRQVYRRKNNPVNNRIEVGDVVTIANRFFDNHGLQRHDLGVCIVSSISISTALLEISYNAILYKYQALNILKVFKGQSKTHIEIHPVYLQKLEVRKHAKEKVVR